MTGTGPASRILGRARILHAISHCGLPRRLGAETHGKWGREMRARRPRHAGDNRRSMEVDGMRVVFCGTGAIAVPALRHLLGRGPRPCLVVSQPDRPAGRHLVPAPPPVKQAAVAAGVPVFQPESVRDGGACERIAAERPDVIVMMAYGQLVPRRLLEIPRLACINLHASLLPRHRGAACIQAAIDAGDAESGITVMHVAPRLDSGDVIIARKLTLRPDETGGSLHDRLADLAPEALAEALAGLAAGTAPRIPQDETLATSIGKLGRDDGWLDWGWPAARLERRIRAFDPWPGTATVLDTADGPRRLKVFPPTGVVAGAGNPGEVLAAGGAGVVVACGLGALRLGQVQPDGSRRMTAGEFARAGKVRPGMVLGAGGAIP